MNVKISIILINYNSAEYTINAVKSIINIISNDLTYEVIIVDNCSNREELSLLKEFLKSNNNCNLQLIESEINLGFSGGNMIGASISKGNYLAFVNNDTFFYEDCFSILLKYLEENHKIGVITCQSINKDGNNFCSFDHFIGIRKTFLGRFVLETFFNKPIRKKTYDKPIKVDAVQGCFMLFERNIFYDVEGFDTNLFLFYEEIDICKRLKDKGYSSVFYPSTQFTHFQGGSTKKSIAIKSEILISFLYILKKDFGKTRYKIISFYLGSKYLIKSIFVTKYKTLYKIVVSKNKFEFSLKNKK
uniref:glycosyltransferase family 2 protein n=2 Tax=Flavobacterium sp. TaxID=239 RepID=UPI00404B8D9E